MKVIGSDMVVHCDVDNTLVMWNKPHGPTSIVLKDPYNGAKNSLVPHTQHIDLLKKYKNQGYTVIVWSAGGKLWAETVVNALGLSDVVDFAMCKSVKYVDDLQASEVLGSRVYIPFEGE